MRNLKSISKFMSLILRHDPGRVGIELDNEGWVEVAVLIDAMNKAGKSVDLELIQEVVMSNDKQRFTFSEDGSRIRANQGHSVSIDLKLEPQVPPEFLFHGTATKNLDSIRSEGLDKRARQHVHLSADKVTATKVGQRHGKVVILNVRSGDMHRAGFEFFLSKNGVWLTDSVPVEFIG
ncbi:MAG: RNA 2'-phosphotransferase [Lentisphaeraceae bacterium]|nr:RNA 2'-phosphotransferase [Lentisphaeraceae bacterium]